MTVDPEKIRQRMAKEGIPVGTDDPLLLSLGATPLPTGGDVTAQWTIDDDGRLVYPLPDRDGTEARAIYISPGTFAVLWPDHPGESESHEAHAALVADVRAARLVDDMAAVVEHFRCGHWMSDGEWWTRDGRQKLGDVTPGQEAALHYARQQEET